MLLAVGRKVASDIGPNAPIFFEELQEDEMVGDCGHDFSVPP